MIFRRVLWLWADLLAYAAIILIAASLFIQTAPAASYHVAMIKQMFELNGLTAGRDVLTPNGELWHVDEVVVSAQDTDGDKKVVITPKISAHRIR